LQAAIPLNLPASFRISLLHHLLRTNQMQYFPLIKTGKRLLHHLQHE
jgi:hypothetical protein